MIDPRLHDAARRQLLEECRARLVLWIDQTRSLLNETEILLLLFVEARHLVDELVHDEYLSMYLTDLERHIEEKNKGQKT